MNTSKIIKDVNGIINNDIDILKDIYGGVKKLVSFVQRCNEWDENEELLSEYLSMYISFAIPDEEVAAKADESLIDNFIYCGMGSRGIVKDMTLYALFNLGTNNTPGHESNPMENFSCEDDVEIIMKGPVHIQDKFEFILDICGNITNTINAYELSTDIALVVMLKTVSHKYINEFGVGAVKQTYIPTMTMAYGGRLSLMSLVASTIPSVLGISHDDD